MNAEQRRLSESALASSPWRRWGPYLSERQWGTVREDYSPDGSAWEYFTHEQAAYRAYRWGEDGLAGVCDAKQHLCLSLALWNEKDPILKERLFGLTNHQGNHGEDVKELYYYLDATPTNSYLKMLYKYPQCEFPYQSLVEENQRRGRSEPEYELFDTGVFDDNRYFDVFVEYAKASPDDLLMRVTVHNRGPEQARLHVIPQIWFRNTWSWKQDAARPELSLTSDGGVAIKHDQLGEYRVYMQAPTDWLFCENDTNPQRLGDPPAPGYFKDGLHEYIIKGRREAVNPANRGTKAGAHYILTVPAGGEATVRMRLSADYADYADNKKRPGSSAASPPASSLQPPASSESAQSAKSVDEVVSQRRQEADEFYAELQAGITDSDARNVHRQALAGMIWSKQFYHWDIPQWLEGDPTMPPPPPQRKHGRDWQWQHVNNADVLSMPDKWEFPWYAAWDLGFHCVAMALIDPEFAKSQLVLLAREWYMHPNGQLPAYEWALGDVNPPVHAWATWRVFQIDRKCRCGTCDIAFLERVFHKLLLNFTWWVNRKDALGRNIFQGGFLGLDNIGVLDRSAALPHGGFIDQADGTSWMAMYCLNLMRISLELALHDPVYQDIATKFFEHFLDIAKAMTNIAETGLGLWDDTDEFYYDVLKSTDGRAVPLRIRSMVGLIPLFAVETLEPEMLDRLPEFKKRLDWYLQYRPDLANLVSRWNEPGRGERRLLSLLRGHRMKCLLRRMLDETEFLSDHGVRAMSRYHLDHPFEFHCGEQNMTVKYLPGESDSGLFGGNSNWRGPVWFPVNYLIIESLQKFHHYYGDDFKIECPTGSGRFITINEVAQELTRRLTRLFLRDATGVRPVFGACEKMQTDLHFRDYILFHECFHGDTGRGIGASHQTGWTGLVAKLLQPRRPEPHQ